MLDSHTHHLKDRVIAVAPKVEEDEDLGPCASRATPRSVPGLHVYNGPLAVRSFQYVHLDYEEFASDGTWFVVLFASTHTWRLTVRGRNLWKVYNYIHFHRLEWIRKADRDFGDDKQPIITGIEVIPVEE